MDNEHSTESSPAPNHPLGALVTGPSTTSPSPIALHGRTITLSPLHPSHLPYLHSALNHPPLWDYMLNEPFGDLAAFSAHYTHIISFTANSPSSPLYFAVLPSPPPNSPAQPEGLLALMDISPHHRSLEIGHVIFSPKLQHTTAATEAISLALSHAFSLNFTRVVWKCNNLNEASKKAARRLGFEAEGVSRWHMVVKGRVRDTAWFSVTVDRWPWVGGALERWLGEENFDEGGRQRVGLVEMRERRGER